jgi:hypothetical protein
MNEQNSTSEERSALCQSKFCRNSRQNSDLQAKAYIDRRQIELFSSSSLPVTPWSVLYYDR